MFLQLLRRNREVRGKCTMRIGGRSSGTACDRATTKYKLLMWTGYCRVNFNHVLCQRRSRLPGFVYSWLTIVSLLNSPPGHYARRRWTRSKFAHDAPFQTDTRYIVLLYTLFYLLFFSESFLSRARQTNDASFSSAEKTNFFHQCVQIGQRYTYMCPFPSFSFHQIYKRHPIPSFCFPFWE